MTDKQIIHTDKAPAAIGPYSQAVRVDNTVYISGQIPLNPETMEVVDTSFEDAADRVFKNLGAIIEAAGGDFSNVVKVTIFLTDLSNFNIVNDVMKRYCSAPYPARAAVGVASLPKDVPVEAEAIMVLD